MCLQQVSEKFVLKNTKRKHCNNQCKNKAGYETLLKNFSWEINNLKLRKKNVRILQDLFDRKIFTVTFHDLKILGFEIEVAVIPHYNEANQAVFRYGEFSLTQIERNKYSIRKQQQ